MRRCSSCSASRTCASVATVSGAASRRSVCPVGAVSTIDLVVFAASLRGGRPRSIRRARRFPESTGSSSASTSSRSSQVPCSTMSPSACWWARSHRANARRASISAACSVPGIRARPREADAPRTRREPRVERIAERVRGIGGDRQHTASAGGRRHRPRRGARRLADAALTGKEGKVRRQVGF